MKLGWPMAKFHLLIISLIIIPFQVSADHWGKLKFDGPRPWEENLSTVISGGISFEIAKKGNLSIRQAGVANLIYKDLPSLYLQWLPTVKDLQPNFDHVLSWNVIYQGDESIVLNTISGFRRVFKPGGTFLLTILSNRRLWLDRKNLNRPRETSRNTWVFDENSSDKIHPHYYFGATEMLCLFQGFEMLSMEDREHAKPDFWHLHLNLERQA